MIRPLPPISAADREHVLAYTADLWRDLAGARFFITGGTGFYGKWLLESIAAANDRLGARVRATILSRDPARFGEEVPHLAARREFDWLAGDAASFTFPAGHVDYVLHFATASAAEVGAGDTAPRIATLRGTGRVLELARACGARRMLFASSGAVYGRQPAQLSQLPEDYRGTPDPGDPASAYGDMKRQCEAMCAASGVDCVVARGFSFVGPYLPLTDKFAIGSFLRDALAGGPIRIRGDGAPLRSYLYAADLAIWLLTLLARGKPARAYNVGSDEAVSIRELAECVAACGPGTDRIVVEGDSALSRTDIYIPSIQRARSELGLSACIDLPGAVTRSITWAMAAR